MNEPVPSTREYGKVHNEKVLAVAATKFEYAEKPVSIITFLKDDRYLGKVTRNLKAVYPGWVRALAQIFDDDTTYLIVLTGAIGVGKSMVVCGYCLPYIMYRIGCLKDPWKYFEKQNAGDMEIYFFNLTKSLSGTRGFSYLQNSIQNSPWFQEKGRMLRSNTPEMVVPGFRWALASPYAKGFGTLGGNVVAGVMDEVDSPNESEGAKKRVLQAYENTVRRFESRFVKDGQSLGRLFLVASKQDELSFLEVFIEEMKHSKRVLVFDKPQWEILPKSHYSGIKFPVMVGDAYLPARILEAEEKDAFIKQGMRVVDIPVEHKFDFERDIVGALRDLAGIAVKGLRKHKLFPAERFIKACFDEDRQNPISLETIVMGLLDEEELNGFVDLSKLVVDPHLPRCMHIDIGISHDALGLACSVVSDWVEMEVEMPDGTFTRQKMPSVTTDFLLRLKARDGDRIPLHKVRKVILWLKARGLNIQKVSIDLRLASEDMIQILSKAGIACEYLSVDTNPKPYLDFKNLVFEERWSCFFHKYLFFELKHLEYDRNRNKIDHPDKVKDIEILGDGNIRDVVLEGSKDLSDALVGSVYQAMQMAKPPVDTQQYVKALKVLSGKTPTDAFGDDWFISDKSKAELGQGVLVAGAKPSAENVEKIKKALTKLRGMRGMRPGGGIM